MLHWVFLQKNENFVLFVLGTGSCYSSHGAWAVLVSFMAEVQGHITLPSIHAQVFPKTYVLSLSWATPWEWNLWIIRKL